MRQAGCACDRGTHVGENAGRCRSGSGAANRCEAPPFFALNSLRGIFACCVAISHFHSDGILSQSTLIQRAGYFVDFFFVLSGFVIMASYGGRLRSGFSTLRFMALRVGRLYPLHVAVMSAMAAVQLMAGVVGPAIGLSQLGDYPVPAFVRTLFLVQIFSTESPAGWNLPTWSIAAEIWAYLIFAALCRFSGRLFPIAIVAMIVVAPAFSPDYVFTIRTGALPRCLYGFGIGVLCYLAWQFREAPLRAMTTMIASFLEIGAVSSALAAICLASPTVAYFLCPWLFASVILLLAAGREASLVSCCTARFSLSVRCPIRSTSSTSSSRRGSRTSCGLCMSACMRRPIPIRATFSSRG
ncbi:acyltransferase [Sphingomonas sp. BIUV-7]|uniref:Acyltransferase n=1 Tax=Sphingomonas natans TaxID=3063330 RepID=A0ABT8Y4Z4_9SPHN|nr:acyltransferase [Sphingomonas sp. BIUV-7]MDO6413393.1 acyltransferase [Sphingomonas sp. BIUV-7]